MSALIYNPSSVDKVDKLTLTLEAIFTSKITQIKQTASQHHQTKASHSIYLKTTKIIIPPHPQNKLITTANHWPNQRPSCVLLTDPITYFFLCVHDPRRIHRRHTSVCIQIEHAGFPAGASGGPTTTTIMPTKNRWLVVFHNDTRLTAIDFFGKNAFLRE